MSLVTAKQVKRFLSDHSGWYCPFAPSSNLMRAMHELKRF